MKLQIARASQDWYMCLILCVFINIWRSGMAVRGVRRPYDFIVPILAYVDASPEL